MSEQDYLKFQKLHEYNLGAKKYLIDDPNFNSLWESIIYKYPDKAHFVYELIQNADDAKATWISFILCRDGLIFKHNGTVHFTVTDPEDHSVMGHINSITVIGRSTKRFDNISNTIGKFGVGFKAVFSYTTRPEIYDDNFQFAIEDYIIPIQLEHDHPERKAGETLFYFPFKDADTAYSDILFKLQSLKNPNLFLNNIEDIEWQAETDEKGHFSKILKKQYTLKDTQCRLFSLVNNHEIRDLWLYTWYVNIPGNGNHDISVGYYLDSEGRIDTKVRDKVYCFFPTSENIDLCCIMHAPFLLTDNRQNVTDSDENRLMIEKLAELAAVALPILRDEGIESGNLLIDDNLFEIVPTKTVYWRDGLLNINIFFKKFQEIITKENLLLSRNNVYLGKSDAVIPGRQEIVELIDKEQLNALINLGPGERDFVAVAPVSDYKIKAYLTDTIGVYKFGYQNLARTITADFMQSQTIDWISKFYYSIYDNAKQLLKRWQETPLFRKAPIFKNQHGEWIPPYKGEQLDVVNIYKPSGIVTSSMNVVCAELFNLKNCQTLLDYLGISVPNKFDLIKVLLLKYEGHDFEIEDSQLLEDFETLLQFYRLSTEDEKRMFVDKVKDYRFIVAKRYDEDGEPRKAGEIYVPTSLLNDYLNGDETRGGLVMLDESFYSTLIDKYGITLINEFLISLGAKDFPDVENVQIPLYSSLNEEQKRIADEIPRNYYREPTYYDLRLAGLKHAVGNQNITADISKRIWLSLIRYNGSVEFTVKYFYYKNRYAYGESQLITFLKSSRWLFTKSGGPIMPSEMTINQLKDADYKDNAEWCSYLGILPDTSDILALGATQEQQDTQNKGQIFDDCSFEDVKRARFLLDQEKAREKQASTQTVVEKQDLHMTEPSRKRMDVDSLTDLFSGEARRPEAPSAELPKRPMETGNADIDDIAKKLDEEKEAKLKLEELQQSIPDMEKYSMQWFSSLMKLELKATGEDEYQSSSSISISFAEVKKDTESERIYILKNPSHLIPMKLEEIGGLLITFTFRNQDSFTKSFEVACVRNFSLLVKANKDDAAALSKIDWTQCSKAEISSNTVSDLEKRLCYAFEQLGLPPEYNLKENLSPDISFVFGPPGTGKTTYLAKSITEILDVEEAKILVLTPTNKACDVLTLKLLKQSEENYLKVGRFVTTAEAEIEDSGILKGRDSDFYKQTPCCLVTTIARLPYDGFEGAAEQSSLRNIDWDYIIIDEASMIPIAHIVYAIYNFRTSKIIIAGDPLQIAPIAQESEWKDENIYTMTNLLTFDNPQTEPVQFEITFLDTQYRSVPEIGNLFSNYAYAGLLKNYRTAESGKKLDIEGFEFGTINFMPFRVDRFDSLYGAKKLNSSNIHIYSALLVVEFAKYVSENYRSKYPNENLSIGIICPYAPQAHLINNLLLQQKGIPESVKIVVGTIHGFQGDECDVIISVFNPPTGLKGAANSVLINNRNIVNVAISRARDYLFVFMPSSETDGFDRLYELNCLGNIAKNKCHDVKVFNSDMIETVIFGKRLYLERHSFVTSHQLANIYTEAQAKYEIRVDNNAIDIQIDDRL